MCRHRAIGALILLLLGQCFGKQVTYRFNNSPQLIRDVLKEGQVSGSVVFSGGCKFQDRTGPLPFVGMRRNFSSARETLQHMLAWNSKIRVTQDADGMIRMTEAGVPTDILDVKIHHLVFEPNTPILVDEQLGPLYIDDRDLALTTILTAPDVADFRKAHHVDPDGMERMTGFSSGSKLSVTGELNDVTVSQALDYVLKTFPGYWVYEDASCEDGSRAVRFHFY